MSEKLTHASLKPLVSALPDRMREEYFEWRRDRSAFYRSEERRSRPNTGVWFVFNSPEFLAECLQKLLALHAEIDKRVAMLSGDGYTDSN